MNRYLETAELTASKRPVFSEQEVEMMVISSVNVYLGEVKKYRNGECSLSNHRIVWVGKSSASSQQTYIPLSIPLKHISSVEKVSSFSFTSSKLLLHLSALEKTDPENNSQVFLPPPSPGYIKLSFREGRRDEFLETIQQMLAAKAWISKEKPKETAKLSSKHAGISGIERNIRQEQKGADETVSVAFKDLDALMISAQELVSLAERFCKTENASDSQFVSLLAHLGIPSPVTKESAGTAYHSLLARQLSDFMFPHLEACGGMMLLVDVFCMFNRARGTELVSPDDVLMACRQCQELGLQVRLQEFPSGVLVLRASSMDEEEIGRRLLETIKEHGPMTALQMSELRGMSLALTKQQILAAEALGMLCRDETLDCVRFYENRFLSF